MSKSVRYAARKLPPEARELFIEIFNATGTMDLYDGNLVEYLQVIKQVLTGRQEIIDGLKKKLRDIHALSAQPTATITT